MSVGHTLVSRVEDLNSKFCVEFASSPWVRMLTSCLVLPSGYGRWVNVSFHLGTFLPGLLYFCLECKGQE